jgi:hypothetical protein
MLRPSFSVLARDIEAADNGLRRRPSALLHGCCTRAWPEIVILILGLSFACKTASSLSGAEGIRTPDLRRAKSKPHYRGSSLLFKNTCKIVDLPLEAIRDGTFVNGVRGVVLLSRLSSYFGQLQRARPVWQLSQPLP